MLIASLLVLAVRADVLLWLPNGQLGGGLVSLATYTATCSADTLGGQPLIGTPLVCTTARNARNVLVNQRVYTPLPGGGTSLVAANGATMFSGPTGVLLSDQINRANGNPIPGNVWTGCDQQGLVDSNNNCNDFTSSALTNSIGYGAADSVETRWIRINTAQCNGLAYRVYCYRTLTPKPTTIQPTTKQPTTKQPTTKQPTTPRPTTKQPTTKQPTTKQPTTPRPTTKQPTTKQPTTKQPTTPQPTTKQPATKQPITPQPTTPQPTPQPTTPQPTTPQPTQPTTPQPTTPQPATPEPTTTSQPTTPQPTTTSEPTTPQPTTQPTTPEPTTPQPTTPQPTTPEPTSTTLAPSTAAPTRVCQGFRRCYDCALSGCKWVQTSLAVGCVSPATCTESDVCIVKQAQCPESRDSSSFCEGYCGVSGRIGCSCSSSSCVGDACCRDLNYSCPPP